VLLLRIRFVEAGQDEDDGPGRHGGADAGEMFHQRLLRVVEQLDDDEQDVGLVLELGEILLRVVARLVEAARVEERQQRRLFAGEDVLAGEARAGLVALADLGALGPGEVTDDRGLAALRLAEQPEHRHRRLFAELVEAGVDLLLADARREHLPDPFPHLAEHVLTSIDRRGRSCAPTSPHGMIGTQTAFRLPSHPMARGPNGRHSGTSSFHPRRPQFSSP
jgi:hypothetical protein